MVELFNIGISEDTIKNMIEVNPFILNMSNDEVIEKKELLTSIGCDNEEIINIIGSNPLLLNNSNDEILKLIHFLNSLGFTSLNILFDSNPYILNLETYEIEEYINKRKDSGEDLESIIDELDSNPYLFSEI